eukprot:TRINITY_DN1871_c0_g3_i6.p1 TRINITY_DN1871_c0_g3~~TRINITY_DN1871_c0_g3_i6.p1  ORF type:complete len:768 (+),score=153.05 TRINITY_DN1871_c0_g3_i6:680-2983(+)
MFLMLFTYSKEKVIEYLQSVLDQVQNFGEMIQLIIIEIIRKIVRGKPTERAKYIRCVFTLLSSQSTAVQYEAAHTLASLSGAPTAVKAVASAYINLLVKESDNNVKMIVLDRLIELKTKHIKILQRLTMDVLRALSCPNMDIRRKVLSIAMELVTPANIQEVMLLFKKEMNRTQVEGFENASEYRRILVRAIHNCAVRFPDVAHDVVHVLMDFIGDDDGESTSEIVDFVREVTQTYPSTRLHLLGKLLESMEQIKSSKVYRAVLWIVGEYSDTLETIQIAFDSIQKNLGQLPLNYSAVESEATSVVSASQSVSTSTYSGPRILPDGTYATSTALEVQGGVSTEIGLAKNPQGPSLRHMINVSRDYYLSSVLATTISKLTLRFKHLLLDHGDDQALHNKFKRLHAWSLLYLVCILRLMEGHAPSEMDENSYERICLCFNLLSKDDNKQETVFLSSSRESFADYLSQLQEQQKQAQTVAEKQPEEVKAHVDDLLKVRQFKAQKLSQTELMDEDDDEDLSRATGHVEKEDYAQKLSRIVQLTGFSDPIYAEADILVQQYDVTLDITVHNQTRDTLQNLSLELSTLGDLKLLEHSQTYTIAPYSKKNIKAHVKVSSTETGVIFGSIVYDAGSSNTEKSVVLNEMRIDVLDYITPAYTDDTSFRKMWTMLEWENKVIIHTNITNLKDFLDHIIKSTNMNCLSPPSALKGDCGFLSVNLYAHSVFGEVALANLSIEQVAESGKIVGNIRIRSKTQGIAISLGKKVEACSGTSN